MLHNKAARLHRVLLFLLLGLGVSGPAAAQLDSLGGLTSKVLRHGRAPQEKLFLHLDRPLYLSGETLWLKVYAVDATSSRPLALSSVAYVEVLDRTRRPVLQGKVALKDATGQGSFVLPADLPAGTYTVRAYTSWMQNFAPETFFHGSIIVVNTTVASGVAAGKDSARFDVQFFPEGGNLVAGLRSKVAFKVTAPTGKGAPAEGKVLDARGRTVATFKTLRLGMGSFALTPGAGQGPYTAVLTLGKDKPATYPMPPVYEQGYVLRLEDTPPGQLTVTVDATSVRVESIFLLAHSGQKVAFASQAPLVNGHAVFIVDKARLLDGISHFTLFNAEQKPLCERLYFQRPRQQLSISARADQAQYPTRGKVTVDLATASQQIPLAAGLSMAVYRLDSLNAAPPVSIDQYLGLTSDLKGTIENPGYYFSATGPEAAEAADNLMLTQGWSRFRWEDVLGPPTPLAYLPEPNGLVVRGRLTQAGSDLPRAGVTTFLSTPSRLIRLNNSVSRADGLVQFEMNNFYSLRRIVVQTDPGQDSTCRITIFDPYSTRFSSVPAPAFRLNPRFQADYARRHLQTQVQRLYDGPARNRFVRLPADSLAFYGQPDETYFLDKFTRFQVLEEVLREYVPGVVVRLRKDGFHFLVVDNLHKTVFEDNPMTLLDGVPVFNLNKLMALSPLRLQKLEVISRTYVHGRALYKGVVSFTTYKGDLAGFQLDPRVLVQQYEGLQRQREFYAPRYDTPQEKQSRLPDLRNLLYWNPAITTSTTPQKVEFYTGDQAGRYVVVVQGLSATGLPGSTSFTVEVKAAL
ncbi:hypothetical protein LJY25_06035 [Hymenobacter sp. BT175]|uniref:MG2 domain-containing protein n=1 Tax=Hymenobacter translucens TaxID=2886507 RepID=UPI001D0F0736|nr:MG2 domain-containing protein [Hymenobacter translucens]MCC2545997.1 hypothetical protein [Hymenobacter translucens]